MAQSQVMEGFLCPICMKDLGNVSDLQDHFEEEHSAEDRQVLNQLKGLFGKAKRKILGNERFDGTETNVDMLADGLDSNTGLFGIDPSAWEPQELGATRSYTDFFKRTREARIDRYVVETNKLLIRLDKLVQDMPTEPNKRKAFEKNIVPWAPDKDVNLCTSCGRSFTLTRRRHHCRLCGSIICNRCSHFLPASYGKNLTNPAFQYEGDGFHRSTSNSSLNSIMSPEGEPHIRTCEHCRMLLERRDMQVRQRNYRPPIVVLYEKMKLYIDDAQQVLPTFLKMAESLQAGETSYHLGEAKLLRQKVVKHYESIDSLSKRIASLGMDAPDPPHPKVLQLQRSIRTSASHFMQQNMLGLQSLPTQEELVKLQEAKRIEIQRRLEAERELHRKEEQLRMEKQKRQIIKLEMTSPSAPRPATLNKQQVGGTGWTPVEVSSKRMADNDDPMVQQMNIIRSYIKQAQQAQKWDEVNMLEENLRELQKEYWRQQTPANTTQDINPSKNRAPQDRGSFQSPGQSPTEVPQNTIKPNAS